MTGQPGRNGKKLTPEFLLRVYFGLAALEAMLFLVYTLSLPPDSGNSHLLGYSLPRWSVIILLLLAAVISASLAIYTWRSPAWCGRLINKLIQPLNLPGQTDVEDLTGSDGAGSSFGWIFPVLLAVAFLFFSLIFLFPPYRFGIFEAYVFRLRPLFLYLALVCGQTLVVYWLVKSGIGSTEEKRPRGVEKQVLFAFLFFMGLALITWGTVASTRLGLTPDIFWDKTGVPILSWQVLLVWGLGMLVIVIGRVGIAGTHPHPNPLPQEEGARPPLPLGEGQGEGEVRVPSEASGRGSIPFMRSKWLDIGIFILIWIMAAIVWNLVPQPHSHFAPGPYPPNYEYYPYSDAMSYDVDAQFSLIGSNLGGPDEIVDKPLFAVFLLFLHLVSGQRIQTVVALQASILAVFPALLYLIGKTLHSRAVGIVVALLAIFKIANSISGTLIIWTVSHPKLMMSEFPTAVCLALLTLFVILWLRGPERKPYFALAAGGVLGLATLIRHNVWLLLPVILLAALFVYGRNWRRWFFYCGLFLFSMLITIAPWMWRNYSMGHSPFYFLPALQGSVWENRIVPEIQVEPSNKVLTATPDINLTQSPQPMGQTSTQLPTAPTPSAPASSAAEGGIFTIFTRYQKVIYSVANNFSHNLITSVLSMPLVLQFDDLAHIVEAPDSIWDYGWVGKLSLGASLLLLCNLGLISLGLGFSWTHFKIVGLLPFLIYLGYNLATGLARTSGGRYIVPSDWVIYLYYGLGLVQLTLWGMAAIWGSDLRKAGAGPGWEPSPEGADSLQPKQPESPALRAWWKGGLAIFLVFFVIGLTLPLADVVNPSVFPSLTESEVVEMLAQDGLLEKIGFTLPQAETFAGLARSRVSYGRALYPRFLDPKSNPYARELYSNLPDNIPHLVFSLIRPQGIGTVNLPLQSSPDYFPNASDVVVIGCRSANYLDAFAVVILRPQVRVYLSPMGKNMTCP
jgi:hypothetical protein